MGVAVADGTAEVLAEVLGAWTWHGEASATVLSGGLINASWRVRDARGDVAVVQRLNTQIFGPEVHLDLHAVTEHLAAKGLATPRLIQTQTGSMWFEHASGVYRALTWIGDATLHRFTSLAQARSAAVLVARFHGALRDFDRPFSHVREGAHDVGRHLLGLRDAVDCRKGHPLHAEVASLSDALEAAWERLSPQLPQGLPKRVIHGDLKVSNIRFEEGQALALVDLDTLARGTLDVELGDALRSWCNRASEDSAAPAFDEALFSAASGAYVAEARRWGLSDVEASAIRPGVARVALTLAARFARDALEERYFGWDRARFGSAGEHNLLRARGQAALVGQVVPSAAVSRSGAGTEAS